MYVADVATGKLQADLQPESEREGSSYEIAFEPGAPSWGPDSNTIALAVQQSYSTRFREGESEILTVDASTGATHMYDPYPYETITNRVEGDGPVWSPDGKHMAYVLDEFCGPCPSIGRRGTGGPGLGS